MVICAESPGGGRADDNIKALYDIGKKLGWEFSVTSKWTKDVKKLGLKNLWGGVRPAILAEMECEDTIE
ncbi:hypothetical protein TWF730_004331 [Orbilia blumenaviensis]|uniref:Uncharacterized protein n=1 Tax=Orbilia blumenaviensis TaxID=1796055 RepID=A0AAV9U0J4_9PEZI